MLATKLTRNSSRLKRILIGAFVLAVALTPSIIVAHTLSLAPAAFILVMAPFVPPAGLVYAALLGALPIIIVWLAIAAIWAAATTGGPSARS
jgi:hypothetical protein